MPKAVRAKTSSKGTQKPAPVAAAKAVKKTAAKKPLSIKYEDKSKGQSPELVTIWQKIKALMAPYEKGVMKSLSDKPGQYTLINHKPFESDGKKRDELWFAAALIQKGYVGFYFMPAHSKEEAQEVFGAELLACLKGKSCFHIKKDDPVLLSQIKQALKAGYSLHKSRGWI